MKALGYPSMAVIAVAFCGAIATAQAPKQPPAANTQDPATIKDIQATLGFVPQWLRAVPAELLPSFWSTLKTFQMGTETALDGKTKELIGLAVAAQIPCEYCVMFHTDVARMHGASDQEIREAVGMAAVTREASTMLNGLAVDRAQFRKDLDRMVRNGKQQAKR